MEYTSQTEGPQTQPASEAVGLKPATTSDHMSGGDRLRELAQVMNGSPAVQRLQSVSDSIQRKEPEEEELLQPKSSAPVQANRTGLPDNLKSGIESLSGLSMDHVQVHRNSSKPAQLNAHAFAQGSDIHLAPGQEQHLPHEAWHVVQQAQGRVKPTMQMKSGQMKGGVPVNDDAGLEQEADVMGARAMQTGGSAGLSGSAPIGLTTGVATAQCKWLQSFKGILRWDVLLGGMQWYFDESTDKFIYQIIDKSAVPPEWLEIVGDNEGKPLSEQAFDELGFETLESAPDELIPERGRDTLRENTRAEDRTRIGFEIENSWHFTTAIFEGYESVVNRTMLTYVDDSGPLLEFLLDDARLIHGGKGIDFQAEFRTTPLAIHSIGPEVSKRVKAAITTLKPKDLFTEKSLSAGWNESELYNELKGKRFETQTVRFTAPAEMAQHVTSSINVESYTRLSPEEQKSLFEKGAGSENKVQLYGKILSAMAEAEIDATTTGRNTAGAMVKTPIEAMLAGEESIGVEGHSELLDVISHEKPPKSVKVSRTDKYPIGELIETARSIVEGGEYPSIQGEHGRGYLARAEKLQPPLIDPENKQLRVLVEHRTDDLRGAFNFILSGREPRNEKDIRSAGIWTDFVQAAGHMDDLAREK